MRPPLARERLERREDGTVVVSLKRAWSDGTTALELSPLEFVERLVAIIPPPRANTIVYRGVLAGNAAWRKEVIPAPKAETPQAVEARRASRLSRKLRGKVERERAGWAELLERVFGVHGYRCPQCAGPLVLRTIVLHPQTTRKILKGLERARGPPPGVCAGEDREA